MIEVEERCLRAFEEHALARVDGVVEQVDGVADVRRQAGRHTEIVVADLVGRHRQAVVDLGEQPVLLTQRELELLLEDLGVEEVLDAQPTRSALSA